MLEPVALNQTRFNISGLAPDHRGILMGREGALLFASLDRLIGFFRMFAYESSMDDLLPKLKIYEVRTPLFSRELLVVYAASTSYVCDRIARLAALHGGLAFTGSGKHFVKYRDNGSPLGYDARALHTEPADFVLYGDTFTHGYHRIRELDFAQLLFRLSLRRVPGGRAEDLMDHEPLWLIVRRGLAAALVTYLWRSRVRADAAFVLPEDSSAGPGSFGQAEPFLLLQAPDLPPRMLALFVGVPGVELYRAVADNVVVEVGYRHPMRLESCASVFDKGRFYLFTGSRDAVDVLRAIPPLVPVADLVGGGFAVGEHREPVEYTAHAPERLEVPLKLLASPSARRPVTATLVSWSQADWLRKIVYTLPPTMLSGYRIAGISDGLFIIGEQGIDGLPIGDMFQEAAPSIFVPLGMEFFPRVGPEVLTDHIGGVNGRSVLFLRQGPPLALAETLFEPLGRNALAKLVVLPRHRDARLPSPREPLPVSVVNDELSPLPLWGFSTGKRRSD